jgi:hypothetical protein
LEKLDPVGCHADGVTLDPLGIGVRIAPDSAVYSCEESLAEVFVAVLGLISENRDLDKICAILFGKGIVDRQVEVADSSAVLRPADFRIFGQTTDEIDSIHIFIPFRALAQTLKEMAVVSRPVVIIGVVSYTLPSEINEKHHAFSSLLVIAKKNEQFKHFFENS